MEFDLQRFATDYSIYEKIKAQELAAYYQEKVSNQVPYLGEGLFPNQKTDGLSMKWLERQQELPIALTMSDLDAKPTTRDRKGFSEKEKRMPFFRESMLLKEKDRQEINKLLTTNNSDYLNPIIQSIFDDSAGLIEGARVQAERMRMQLLSSFKVDIQFNRLRWQVDYDPENEYENNIKTLTSTDKWTDFENSNPLEHIRERQNYIEQETGTKPTIGICTRQTFNYLMQNQAIKNDMWGDLASKKTMYESDLRQHLKEKLGLETIIVYNKKYQQEKRSGTGQFFPDDVFTLAPNGNLGNTWFGTTPEESDYKAGLASEADLSIVNTGVAVLTRVQNRTPINVETVVSAIMGCTFNRLPEIGILKVNG